MSTFIEIQEFLDLALEKVKLLTPASFAANVHSQLKTA